MATKKYMDTTGMKEALFGRAASAFGPDEAARRAAGRAEGSFTKTVQRAATASKPKPKKKKGIGNILLKALQLVDTPRAAVASGVKEFADVLGPGRTGSSASWSDFVQQITHADKRLYGSDFIGEGGPDILQNKFLKTGIGFGLDVGMDPLTYVGGIGVAAKGAKVAAEHVAEVGAKSIADDAVKRGFIEGTETLGDFVKRTPELAERQAKLAEDVSKVRRLNVSALDKPTAEQYGLRHGLQIHAPFSNAQLPITAGNPSRVSRALHEVYAKVGDVVLGTVEKPRILKGLTESSVTALKARSGLGQDTFEAVLGQIKSRKIPGLSSSIERRLATSAGDIMKTLPKEEHETFVRALRGNAEAIAKLGEVAPKARKFLDDVHEELTKAGVQVRRTESYFPNVLTPEARTVLGIEGAGGEGAQAFFEKARTLGYEDGKFTGEAKFLGEAIHGSTPDEIVDAAEKVIAKRIKENPKLQEELGGVAVDLFSKDPINVLSRYIQKSSHRIASGTVVQELSDLGIGQTGRVAKRQVIEGAEEDAARWTKALQEVQGEQLTEKQVLDALSETEQSAKVVAGQRALDALEAAPDIAEVAKGGPALVRLAQAAQTLVRAEKTRLAAEALDATKAGYRATAVDNLLEQATTLREEAARLLEDAEARASARQASLAGEAKAATAEAKALQAQVDQLDQELSMIAELDNSTAHALEHEAAMQRAMVENQNAVNTAQMSQLDGLEVASEHFATVDAAYAQAKRMAQFGSELDDNIAQLDDLIRNRKFARGASNFERAFQDAAVNPLGSRSAEMARNASLMADETIKSKVQNILRYAASLDSPEQWRQFIEMDKGFEKRIEGFITNRVKREQLYALARSRASEVDLAAEAAVADKAARSLRARVVATLKTSDLSWKEVQEPRVLKGELEIELRNAQSRLRELEGHLAARGSDVGYEGLAVAPERVQRMYGKVADRVDAAKAEVESIQKKMADLETIAPQVEAFQKATAQSAALKGPRLAELERLRTEAERAMVRGQNNFLKEARVAKAKGRTLEQQLDHAHRAVIDAEGAKAELAAALEAQAERVGKVTELTDAAAKKSKASKEVTAKTGQKFRETQAKLGAVERDLSKYGVTEGPVQRLGAARERIIERISTPNPSPETRRASEAVMAAIDSKDMARIHMADTAELGAQKAAESTQKARVIRDILDAGDVGNPEMLLLADDIAQSYEEAAKWGLLSAEQGGALSEDLRKVASYRQAAEETRARIGNLEMLESKLSDKLDTLHETIMAKTDALRSNMFSEIRFGTATPQSAADAILDMEKPLRQMGTFMRHYHRVVQWLKAWQIATPGFSIRNSFGGMWQNALAGTNPVNEFELLKVWRQVTDAGTDAAKLAKIDPEKLARFREVESIVGRGLVGTELSLDEVSRGVLGRGAGMFKGTTVLPSRRNFIINWGRRLNEKVEFGTRAMLAWDQLAKGLSQDEALSMVLKFHFDYGDLSRIEQGIREVVPFYTWSRYNIPLQVEMLARHPSTFARYEQVKNEIEANSDPDASVANWMVGENLGIRLPLTGGGGHVYAMPDLPLRDLARFDDLSAGGIASDLISQVTPVIKAPLEYQQNKQFFKDLPLRTDKYTELNPLLAKVPGLTNILGATGHLQHVDGHYLITEKDAYMLDQGLPILGRLRRLAPNEKKYQDKLTSSWLSLFGLGVRTNSKDEQEIDQYVQNLEKQNEEAKQARLQRAADQLNGQ